MSKRIRNARIIAVILLVAIVGYYLYDVLTPLSTNEKLARIIHLEDRRELSGRLKAFLNDSEPKVRLKAALAVGRIGGKGAGQILYDMLSDSSWQVASTAAFALGLTGDENYARRVIDDAYDAPIPVCLRLVEAAGRLADSSMSDVAADLVGFLQHPSPDIRKAACMAIFRAGGRVASSDIIKLMYDEPDEDVRQAGLYVLARFGVSDASGIFIDYLSDLDPYIRALAIRGLGTVKSPEAERYLTIALNDADNKVVAQAVSALSSFNSITAGKALERKLEMERDEKLIVAIINALARLKNNTGIETAYLLADRLKKPNIVAATAKYAAVVQGDRAVNYIDSLMRVGGPYLRAACADAFGKVGRRNVIPRLAVLFNDEDPLVRAAAFGPLIKIDTEENSFYIDQALNDQDFVVNTLAVEEISKSKQSKYLPALRTMMSLGSDTDNDLRRTLVEAMAPFVKEAVIDSNALAIVRMGLTDPEYIVRLEADHVQNLMPDKMRRPVLLLEEKTRFSERQIRKALEKYKRNPYATIVTSKGEMDMELYFDAAPLTVMNFIELADDGFYDGLRFHRVIPNFVVQGGDPRGDGYGGPGYYIRCEYSDEPYRRGTVGIATSGKDTGGSQFFITLSPQPHLEGRYTVFGQVLGGMDIVDKIVVGDTIRIIIIKEGE